MRASTPYLVFGGLAVALVAAALYEPHAEPPRAPPPPLPPPGPDQWAELRECESCPHRGWVWLGQGWQYRAVIKLPWFVPTPSESTVREYAEKKGFRDVTSSRTRPTWTDAEGDLYVLATWGKPSQWFERASAITKAWVKL